MKTVFADSFYFIALLNAADAANAAACAFTAGYTGRYVTTSAVLTELADALARPTSRVGAARFITELPANKSMRVIPVDPPLFDVSVKLYLERPDKDWSLTDCISFVVMQRERIHEALSYDHHFEQAGFIAVLK